MMLQARVVDDVTAVLQGSDFRDPAHELVFDTIVALAQTGRPVDAITVADALGEDLRKAGGSAYLHTLLSSVPTAENAPYYAGFVRSRALRRRLDTATTRIEQLRESVAEDDELVNAVHAELAKATASRRGPGRGLGVGADFDAFLEHLEEPETPGILWPFTDLNRDVNPLTPGQLIVVGARPAVGKTSLGLDIARHAALRQAKTVVFHSLEMGRREIQMRLTSAEARVRLSQLVHHQVEQEGWQRIAQAADRLTDSRLVVDDDTHLTIQDLRSSIRQHRADLVVVDYLQLGTLSRADSRREAIEQYSRGLKLLAKDLKVPVVALAQLNRGPEQRNDKRPYLSDLRESGAVEQDADVVLLLHREEMYNRETTRAGEADVIIAKQRNGSTGTVALGAQLHYSRFCDLASSW